jgi:hypothetical protein
MIEGRLFALNYEGLLPGPIVIPLKQSVRLISGTSSLQGNMRRQLIVELKAELDGEESNSTRTAWICYALEESCLNLQGPATALQVLQVN